MPRWHGFCKSQFAWQLPFLRPESRRARPIPRWRARSGRFPLIDILLGGEGQATDLARDLTDIEDEVLEGIVRIICRDLQMSWQAINLEYKFRASQSVLQAQRLMPPEEKNLCLSFEIKMAESRGTLTLAVPALVSNALLRKISADRSYQRPNTSIEVRNQIQNRLLDCSFSIDLVMPRLDVSLEALSRLSPGVVLPFGRSISTPAILEIDEIRLCSALPVRVSSRRAARVVALEPQPTLTGEP